VGGCGVQPGQAALAAQSSLLEVHHRCGDQVGSDLVAEWVEILCGAGGGGGLVSVETGVPNSSDRATAVRFLDRN
jgi:hypothetical protein